MIYQCSPRLMAAEYHVTSMPDVDFKLGEMYAGNIPIGSNASEALYFVFHPKLGAPTEDLTIWLNGGPGCSSLEGFFQENGPFVWQWGTYAPTQNPYSWVNLTNSKFLHSPGDSQSLHRRVPWRSALRWWSPVSQSARVSQKVVVKRLCHHVDRLSWISSLLRMSTLTPL